LHVEIDVQLREPEAPARVLETVGRFVPTSTHFESNALSIGALSMTTYTILNSFAPDDLTVQKKLSALADVTGKWLDH
jgi:hypothetical protein